MAPTPTKRTYDSSRRTLQAAQTRDAVVHAAMERFSATGWAGTTLADIAEAAGVSVETIYKGFGSKKGLLRARRSTPPWWATPSPCRSASGPSTSPSGRAPWRSASPTPPPSRPRSTPGPPACGRRSSRRPAPTRRSTAGASSSSSARHQQIADSVTLILGGVVDDQLATMAWILYSSETYLKLVQDRGSTRAEYEAFLVDATQRML